MEILAFLVVSFVLYFLPTVIATCRHHHNQGAILLLNFLLGWTALGWVVALIWAFISPTPVRVIHVAEGHADASRY